MSHKLELPDEVYEKLLRRAEAAGMTPQQWIHNEATEALKKIRATADDPTIVRQPSPDER